MSHRARSTFSSNVGSTTVICSPPAEETVSRRSRVEKLSLHFVGGAAGFGAASELVQGGGETDFAGAIGGELPNVDESALEPALPDGIEDKDGLEGWECEAWLVVGEPGAWLSTYSHDEGL